MTTTELVDKIRTNFFIKINKKTNWGKDEIKEKFERAVSDLFGESPYMEDHYHIRDIPLDTDNMPY